MRPINRCSKTRRDNIIMAHKKQGYIFENDWPLERMKKAVEETYTEVMIIPVDTEIEVDHKVLNYDNVKQHLINANKISLMDCACRTNRGNCDGPIEVCIVLNSFAEQILAEKDDLESWPGTLHPREVSVDEALEALKKSHEAGLVHTNLVRRDKPNEVSTICSCCTCCCGPLSGVIRYGLAPHLLTSDTTSVTDIAACTDCGDCVDRCQFGAREMVDGSHAFNPDLCFGCGLCVSTCPTNAIKLIDK